jgi:serine/threonine protein kinase
VILSEFADLRPLKRDSLDPTQKAKVAVGVIKAVEYLHDRGIFGIGIKPNNILIDDEGCPMLDIATARLRKFGISSQPTAPTAYDSPEVMIGGQEAGAAADLYALCSILLELATGAPPFDVRVTLFEAVSKGERRRVPRDAMQGGVSEVVESALDRESGNRESLSNLLSACESAGWLLFNGADRLKVAELVGALPVGSSAHLPSLVTVVAKLQQAVSVQAEQLAEVTAQLAGAAQVIQQQAQLMLAGRSVPAGPTAMNADNLTKGK